MPKSTVIPVLIAAASVCSGAMKTIDAQGGKITFGSVDGQSTEAAAMGAVLKSLHTQYGERPQVGKLFEVKGTQSVAAFFGIPGRKIAGEVIVTKVGENRVEAGVVSGDAAHFGSNYNPLMKSLMTQWHPFLGAQTPGQSGGVAVAPLHKFVAQDHSASVDLPDGWKVQQGGGGGTIMALGPNGEDAELGFGFLVADLNNPGAQRTYQTVQAGGLRNTVYANQIYYALNNDMARMRVDLIQLFRKKHNMPPVTLQIKTSEPVQSPPREKCIHDTGAGRAQDGKSTEFEEIFCVSFPSPAAGISLVTITGTYVPSELAAKERPTMGALLASFSIDQAIVAKQAHDYAAPAIEAIHQIGRMAAAQAAAAHARNDAWNSSVYKRWDDNDKRSQGFSNYLLGYSVIRDVDNTAHGTFWNEDADRIVQQFPNAFEYVNVPDFWKGIDY